MLRQGSVGEREIARLLSHASPGKAWEVVYEDPLDGHGEIKTMPSLVVLGQAMRGRPDLVLRERDTGKLVIVERKVSCREIPSDGWPNLRAQLWAYSKISDWAGEPEITLVGEIWGMSRMGVPSYRASVVWQASDACFQRENQALFDLYARRGTEQDTG